MIEIIDTTREGYGTMDTARDSYHLLVDGEEVQVYIDQEPPYEIQVIWAGALDYCGDITAFRKRHPDIAEVLGEYIKDIPSPVGVEILMTAMVWPEMCEPLKEIKRGIQRELRNLIDVVEMKSDYLKNVDAEFILEGEGSYEYVEPKKEVV